MIMRIPTHCNHPWYSIKIGKRLASRYHPSRLCKGIWQSSTPLPSDLHKLEYYGVNPKTNRWIRSFLENRKQSVILEGTVSMQVQVLSGVPQSTVLGPLLFLAYTNDMSEKQLHPRSNYLQMTAFFTVLLTTRLTVTYCRGTLQF